MDPRIEEFSINNILPPDEIIREVNDVLLKPLQDLKDIDIEILALEHRLEELKSKRNDTHEWISRYQTILSPIRRLPQDMLGEIFQYCLPFHTNPILDHTESPLLLTRVCKLWRDVTYSQPRLWSRLHIPFTEADPQDDWNFEFYSPESIASDQEALRRRLGAVKEWFSRAGTRPLSISIHFLDQGIRPQCSPIITEFLRLIALLSPRIVDLELNMPLEIYRLLESMIDVSKMTSLISLWIQSLPRRTGSSTEPILLLKAPNLQQVSSFGCDPNLWGILSPSYSSVWNRLTKISCHKSFLKGQVTSLLEQCTRLVHLAVNIVEDHRETQATIPYQGRISLPFLRTLFLLDRMSSRHRGDLYERIDAPALKWVMFACRTSGWEDESPSVTIDVPIISLLQRATRLEKLSIDPPSIDAWDIENIFRAVPSITHLFVGIESRTSSGSIERFTPGNPDWRSKKPFDFQLLSPTSNPLLPRLQSFEMNSLTISADDEALLRFIKSRMAPSPTWGISVPKHVAFVFYWTQGCDIGYETRRHAELHGIEMIDLVLDYGQVLKTRTRAPKPEAGLMNLQDLQGNHRDVDSYLRFHRLDSSEIF